MMTDEIEATVATVPGCQVVFSSERRLLAWREGLTYDFSVGERQLRISAEIGSMDEVYDPSSAEGAFLPSCMARMSELLNAQYMCAGTAGFPLSIPRGGGPVRLNLVLPSDGLSADVLLERFGLLAESAAAWAARLRQDFAGADVAFTDAQEPAEFRIEV